MLRSQAEILARLVEGEVHHTGGHEYEVRRTTREGLLVVLNSFGVASYRSLEDYRDYQTVEEVDFHALRK